MLPREIYKRLVEYGLDLNIRQKQIHFWWTKIGQNRYKRDENSFLSAQKWLKENSYQIIFQKNNPSALGFLTKLWDVLQNSQFKIYEIGIDATCKYTFNCFYYLFTIIIILIQLYYFFFFLYSDNTAVLAKIDGTEFSLAYLFVENNGNCGNGI